MIYLIDWDTLSVESKTEDLELAKSYIDDNGLDLAVALISSEDELCLQYSLQEMQGLFDNLSNLFGARERDFDNEEDAALYCWKELEDNQCEFPNYTKALGKKLVKAASKPEPKDDSKPDVKLSDKPAKIKIKAKELIGMNFTNTSKSPRNGTACAIMTNFIEENLGEASYNELVETFVEHYVPKDSSKVVDDKLGAVYVREAFINGFIEEGL